MQASGKGEGHQNNQFGTRQESMIQFFKLQLCVSVGMCGSKLVKQFARTAPVSVKSAFLIVSCLHRKSSLSWFEVLDVFLQGVEGC